MIGPQNRKDVKKGTTTSSWKYNRMRIVLLTLTLDGEGVFSFLSLARFNQNYAKYCMQCVFKYTFAVILVLWVCLKGQWHNTVLSISGVLLKNVPPRPLSILRRYSRFTQKEYDLAIAKCSVKSNLAAVFLASQLQIQPYSISANLNSNLKF